MLYATYVSYVCARKRLFLVPLVYVAKILLFRVPLSDAEFSVGGSLLLYLSISLAQLTGSLSVVVGASFTGQRKSLSLSPLRCQLGGGGAADKDRRAKLCADSAAEPKHLTRASELQVSCRCCCCCCRLAWQRAGRFNGLVASTRASHPSERAS